MWAESREAFNWGHFGTEFDVKTAKGCQLIFITSRQAICA